MAYLTDIRAFLAQKLADYVTANPTQKVAWDNVAFDDTTGGYWQFAFAESNVKQSTFGTDGQDLRQGFVQINVMVPEKTGSSQAYADAHSVNAIYPRGLRGTYGSANVLVTNTAIGPNMLTDTHFVIPVTVDWQAMTPPVT